MNLRLSFDGVVLSPQKEVVRVFFKELWDKADKSLIPTIFHPDFTFRGSLGPVLRGHDQFAGYVVCSLVTQIIYVSHSRHGGRRQQGLRQAPLSRLSPRRISWLPTDRTSCLVVRHASFHVRWHKSSRPWVLGDVHGLTGRLSNEAGSLLDGGYDVRRESRSLGYHSWPLLALSGHPSFTAHVRFWG